MKGRTIGLRPVGASNNAIQSTNDDWAIHKRGVRCWCQCWGPYISHADLLQSDNIFILYLFCSCIPNLSEHFLCHLYLTTKYIIEHILFINEVITTLPVYHQESESSVSITGMKEYTQDKSQRRQWVLYFITLISVSKYFQLHFVLFQLCQPTAKIFSFSS